MLLVFFAVPAAQASDTSKLHLTFDVTVIPDAAKLPQSSLPDPGLKITSKTTAVPGVEQFKALLTQLSKAGDPILDATYYPFLKDKPIQIPVVLTQGVPEPYDAWATFHNGKKTFMFNMDMWNPTSLETQGLSVIKHETSHVLFALAGGQHEEKSYAGRLEQIIVNEGIAHFIGYPKDRSALFKTRGDKWPIAEAKVNEAMKLFADPKATATQKDEMLKKAQTGSFWEKYGAIAGMFRAAKIYETSGPSGLVEVIKNRKLPPVKP